MDPDDLQALFRVLGDPETMQHYPTAFDGQHVRDWIERNMNRYRKDGFGLWAVCLKETDELIGDCGLTLQNIHGEILPEIGYHIRRDCQRRGYAREAALASLGMPSTSEPSPAVAQVAAAGAVPADGDAPVPVAPAEPEEVPMADYSGHEGMWADALAILAEDAAPLAEPAEFAAEAGADEEVLASAPRVRAEEVPVNEERVEAIAEGERLTEMHGRVNEILSEEVAKVPSQSMRRTSHEYLRVIQGGTMAMPRLKAEA